MAIKIPKNTECSLLEVYNTRMVIYYNFYKGYRVAGNKKRMIDSLRTIRMYAKAIVKELKKDGIEGL